MHIPEYSDVAYWDDLTRQFIQNPKHFSAWYNIENYLWNYFKTCLRSRNPFFFQHPLIPLLETVFSEHISVLDEGTEIYRARIDEDRKLWMEWLDYSRIESTPTVIERIEKRTGHTDDTQKLWEDYEEFISGEYINSIKERIEAGFQGFDANGSTAPPPGTSSEGRCNPKGNSYLYTALEEHTAVAEIRPHIKDMLSIALLKPLRNLNLINFDYDPMETVKGNIFLFNTIQQEFSLTKRQPGDYLITQYITSLIEHLGYDGICFRSSLVVDGTNYVIFNPTDCAVISSKLCYLSNVIYKYG